MTKALVKILLVEDSPSDAELLQESLADDGNGAFHFALAETWQSAVAQLQHEPFDVMLLDLSLPDTMGRETFLRARAQAPQMPILVLTGSTDEDIGLAAVRHGIQDYLVKGQADGRQTARAIHYAIERKQAETALKQAEAKLQEERDRLEARVRQRTSQLSKANVALKAEMTRRERAEGAHRTVLRRLVAAEETERSNISRELHDRLGQDLTALKLGLQIARKHGDCPPALLASVSKLEMLADRLMQDTHRLAWELRPAALDDFGLELALRRFAGEWSALSGVPVDFHSRGVTAQRLAREVETTLYRVAREALTNVFRHAAAQRVSMLLQRQVDHVSLIVEDDGAGFDLDAVLQAGAGPGPLGLLGMQERASLAGGSLQIESSPGVGTTIFVRMPLVYES